MKQTITCLLLCTMISCASPSAEYGEELPQDPREWFRGRWRLHAIEREMPEGGFEVPERYRGRQGFIVYDGLGGMGVHHVQAKFADYPIPRGFPTDSLTREDLLFLGGQFIYFGRYSVDTSTQVITHHIETDMRPAMWGAAVQRRYEFSGDTLILMPLTADPPSRITWIRVNDYKND